MNAPTKISTGTQRLSVPLDRLRFGHDYPLSPINPRKDFDMAGWEDFRRSVYREGVLQAPRAFATDLGEHYYVYIGNRRLRAVKENAELHMDGPREIEIDLDDITPAEAFARALAEQDTQLPLHKVDRYEAFAELAAQGRGEEEIAERYGIARHVVRRHLALGALAPEIRNAWREGVLDEDAAKAFTLARDHRAQVKLFSRLKAAHQLQRYHIRNALIPDQGDASRLVNFIGIDAYRQAGGEIVEDLFDGLHGVSDSALALELARRKLQSECERLIAEGWGWAATAEELPASWRAWNVTGPKKFDYTAEESARIEALNETMARFRAADELTDEQSEAHDAAQDEFERIETAARLRAFTDKQKRKSGCILSIDTTGRLSIEHGVMRPVEPEGGKVIAPAAGDETEEPEEERGARASEPEADAAPTISNGLARDLAVTLNEAAARVVARDFDLAMAIALAGFAQNGSNGCVRLNHAGLGSNALKLTGSDDMARNLAGFLKMPREKREKLFAEVVAASLMFNAFSAERHAMSDPDIAAIVNALPKEELRQALQARFDPEHYFQKAPKAFAIAASSEALGSDRSAELAGRNKAEAAAFAAHNAGKAGWLPPELRAAGTNWSGAPLARAKAKPRGKAKRKPAKRRK